MNPEHKKYILENIGKKKIDRIADDLHLKEKIIKRFLKNESRKESVDLETTREEDHTEQI